MAVTTTPAAPMRSWGRARGRSVRCAWTGSTRQKAAISAPATTPMSAAGPTPRSVAAMTVPPARPKAPAKPPMAAVEKSAGDPLEAVEQSLEDISEEQRDEERSPTPTIQAEHRVPFLVWLAEPQAITTRPAQACTSTGCSRAAFARF